MACSLRPVLQPCAVLAVAVLRCCVAGRRSDLRDAGVLNVTEYGRQWNPYANRTGGRGLLRDDHGTSHITCVRACVRACLGRAHRAERGMPAACVLARGSILPAALAGGITSGVCASAWRTPGSLASLASGRRQGTGQGVPGRWRGEAGEVCTSGRRPLPLCAGWWTGSATPCRSPPPSTAALAAPSPAPPRVRRAAGPRGVAWREARSNRGGCAWPQSCATQNPPGRLRAERVECSGLRVRLRLRVGRWCCCCGRALAWPQAPLCCWLLAGILLNNEMDDFSRPDLPNAYGLAPSREGTLVHQPDCGRRRAPATHSCAVSAEACWGEDWRVPSVRARSVKLHRAGAAAPVVHEPDRRDQGWQARHGGGRQQRAPDHHGHAAGEVAGGSAQAQC